MVRVIWRADLTEPEPGGQIDEDAWKEAAMAIPPRAEEELELPLAAVRAWLRRQPPATVADDEIPVRNEDGIRGTEQQPERPAVRIGHRRDGEPEIVRPGELRPDDRIVVPATYGGHDELGWAPTSTAPALDIADVVARRRAVVRLNRDTLLPIVRYILGGEREKQVKALLDALDEQIPDDNALAELPTEVPAKPPENADPLTAVLIELVTAVTTLLGENPTTPRRLTLRSRPAARPTARLLLTAASSRRANDNTTAGSSLSERAVPLVTHHKEVGALAADIARQLELPNKLIESLRQAAEWHDLGKLDPRFQTILFAGVSGEADRALLADEPRAKSGIDPANRRAWQAARDVSDYPEDGRHEALSAALVHYRLAHTDTASLDAELVEHLVAAHHGHSRPLLPPVADENRPREVRVPDWGLTVPLPEDFGIDWTSPRRFRRLCERFGIWGLALLEAIVRLADIACSAGEYCKESR